MPLMLHALTGGDTDDAGGDTDDTGGDTDDTGDDIDTDGGDTKSIGPLSNSLRLKKPVKYLVGLVYNIISSHQ